MMHAPEKYRRLDGPMPSSARDGNNGWFYIPAEKEKNALIIVASNGEGWEHVSVSMKYRCPTWEEMCKIKELFWDDEDVVIQYHPSKKDYINNHPFCLHLWRPTAQNIPTPPSILVGINQEK
jgi:hypothetical protein